MPRVARSSTPLRVGGAERVRVRALNRRPVQIDPLIQSIYQKCYRPLYALLIHTHTHVAHTYTATTAARTRDAHEHRRARRENIGR